MEEGKVEEETKENPRICGGQTAVGLRLLLLLSGVENVQNRVERVLSWAAGTLAVRLLVGELPTSAEGGEQPATSFPGDGLYDVHVQQRILNSLSPAASRFVQAALDLNPENRATVLTLRQQPFIWQPSDSSACVDHESGRASMDSWGDSSFGVPRGPSLEASCYSATRTSLAERRGLSVEGYTQPPPGPTAGGGTPPSQQQAPLPLLARLIIVAAVCLKLHHL